MPSPKHELTPDEALNIVLELARQNIIDDPDMREEAAIQEAACDLVEKSFSKESP